MDALKDSEEPIEPRAPKQWQFSDMLPSSISFKAAYALMYMAKYEAGLEVSMRASLSKVACMQGLL